MNKIYRLKPMAWRRKRLPLGSQWKAGGYLITYIAIDGCYRLYLNISADVLHFLSLREAKKHALKHRDKMLGAWLAEVES